MPDLHVFSCIGTAKEVNKLGKQLGQKLKAVLEAEQTGQKLDSLGRNRKVRERATARYR